MEVNNRKLYRGLKLMYIGYLISIIGLFIGTVLLILPGAAVLGILIFLISSVGIIVRAAGLFMLHSEHRDYRNALAVLVASFVCAVIAKYAAEPLSTIMDLADSALSLVEVYLVVHATNAFLDAVGREDLREEGKRALWARAITVVVSRVSSVLTAMISDGQVRVTTHVVISGLVIVASGVFYLIYLKHSSEVLRWRQSKRKKPKR